MTLDDLAAQEKRLMEEVVNRRKLGGYNADAPTLELLALGLYELTRHIREQEQLREGAKKEPKK